LTYGTLGVRIDQVCYVRVGVFFDKTRGYEEGRGVYMLRSLSTIETTQGNNLIPDHPYVSPVPR
jgi:hypothetical protein